MRKLAVLVSTTTNKKIGRAAAARDADAAYDDGDDAE